MFLYERQLLLLLLLLLLLPPPPLRYILTAQCGFDRELVRGIDGRKQNNQLTLI